METFRSCAGQTRCPVISFDSKQVPESPIGFLLKGLCYVLNARYIITPENNTLLMSSFVRTFRTSSVSTIWELSLRTDERRIKQVVKWQEIQAMDKSRDGRMAGKSFLTLKSRDSPAILISNLTKPELLTRSSICGEQLLSNVQDRILIFLEHVICVSSLYFRFLETGLALPQVQPDIVLSINFVSIGDLSST